jgi:hypothetical protein
VWAICFAAGFRDVTMRDAIAGDGLAPFPAGATANAASKAAQMASSDTSASRIRRAASTISRVTFTVQSYPSS